MHFLSAITISKPLETGIPILKLWLLFRTLLALLAILILFIDPQLLHTVGAIKYVTAECWNHWDSVYLIKIATTGYRPDDGTAQFHPLLPLMGGLVGRLLGGRFLIGLLIISSLSGLLFLFFMERLAALDLPHPDARRVVIYFLHAPAAFILFAPYTESLFLLCSILALLFARRGQWWAAGLGGALATLTRQQGLFLLLPLAWEFWLQSDGDWKNTLRNWRQWPSLLLIPTGFLIWICYRTFALSDLSVNFNQPRSLIYGLLISQSATKVVPLQSFIPPWNAFWIALKHLNITTMIDLSGGIFYLMLAAICGRSLWRIRPSYLLYSMAILGASFSLNTGVQNPYMGLPRHCLLAFPLFLPLAIFGRQQAVNLLVLTIGIICLLTMPLFFYRPTFWVP